LFLAAAVTVFFTQAVLAASQTLEGDIYTIKIDTKDGKATVTITPKTVAGVRHHCNEEFPWKLEITQAQGVTTDRTKYEAPFKKADGTRNTTSHTEAFSRDKVVFVIKYMVEPGKKVNGKLTFSVCDEKQCYRKTHNIDWD
jgi:hypothetical protein